MRGADRKLAPLAATLFREPRAQLRVTTHGGQYARHRNCRWSPPRPRTRRLPQGSGRLAFTLGPLAAGLAPRAVVVALQAEGHRMPGARWMESRLRSAHAASRGRYA